MNYMEQLVALGFNGFNLEMRHRDFTPNLFRLSLLANKNERSEYRVRVMGKTFDECAEKLIGQVKEIRERNKSRP